MPSSVTHSYFALDVYKNLPSYCKEKIDGKLEYYKLFSQGSDPFMFYHFLLGKKAKLVSNIQAKMHHEKTRDFFLKIIYFIHDNDLVNDMEVMSYLYGYICHYYLDLYTHPFIYYKSGIFKKDDKSTYKYNGLHQEMEYRIDSYIIEKYEGIDAKDFRLDKFIFDVNKFSSNLEELIKVSIGELYQVDNVVLLYKKCIWYMKNFFRWANFDPYGWKLFIYKVIDKISSDSMIRLSELSFYSSYDKDKDFLNLSHKKWNLPWDSEQVFTTSFLNLYDIALKNAVRTIQEVTIMLENKKINKQRLENIFLNLSFATGVDCKKKVLMKYFEF